MENPKCFCLSFFLFLSVHVTPLSGFNVSAAKADVGVILDLHTSFGKMFKTCISMAIEDFYSKHNYATRIVPHFRNSSSDVVAAASAAIDLLKNIQVMAIVGPQNAIQADFVIDIGNKVRVPIISPATGAALSPKESLYFIRPAWCSSSQAKAIAAIVKAFNWREVAFLYEDSIYGSEFVPLLTEHLLESNALVSSHSAVSPSKGDDQILLQLYKLRMMQTRVFVVHMQPHLASRFFKIAKEAGMMTKGYAWLINDVLTSLLDYADSETIEAMQGVLGVRAYVPSSDELQNFTSRWSKRFHEENPDIEKTELNVFGLWAYDSITALAEAIEQVGAGATSPRKSVNRVNLADLEGIGTSDTGPSLAPLIRNFASKGLSGDFNIFNGELQPSAFEIVNVIGKGNKTVGFWTEEYGISKELKSDDHKAIYSTEKDNFRGILWPGQTIEVPKGWEIPTSGKKIRVGVPVKRGFSEFIKVERVAATSAVIATGFCIDVFEEVMQLMPSAVPFEYIPFYGEDCDDLVLQVSLQEFDAVVGDVTITRNRSKYVDFTLPYADSVVTTVIPIKGNVRKTAWIFTKPLTTGLWVTVGAFFVFTGLVVWVLEHRINNDFRGPPLQQVGTIFWFSFSTLVYAHREKVISNLTRFVVIVWVFVVLVLQSSYTASLTSMLTAEQLRPINIYDLTKNGEYVGYQTGSFVRGLLSRMQFDNSKFRNYSSLEQYDEALSKGSRNGGVGAIVDELRYIKLFLSKYCGKYTRIDPPYPSSGFGFAFPKGSPLVPDISRAILDLKEDEKMERISRKWFKEEEVCSGNGSENESLNVDNFRGLFLIAVLSLSSALAIFLANFLYKNRHILVSADSIKRKLSGLATAFVQEKDDVSLPS